MNLSKACGQAKALDAKDTDLLAHRFDANVLFFRIEYKELLSWVISRIRVEIELGTTVCGR